MAAPYHLNVPGPFYREDGCCVTCAVPIDVAPDLLTFDEDEEYGGCYVKKQPETPEEIARMLRAFDEGDMDCFRYRGADGQMTRKLTDKGYADLCDDDAEAAASNAASERFADERRSRGEGEEVQRRVSQDGLKAISIRSFPSGKFDYRVLRREFLGGESYAPRWQSMTVAGFFATADDAMEKALGHDYWLRRDWRDGPGHTGSPPTSRFSWLARLFKR